MSQTYSVSTKTLLDLAERYRKRGDLESAICVWKNILLYDPYNVDATENLYNTMGVLYLLRGKPHCEAVLSAAWTSDGRNIVVVGSDNTLSIWGYPSGHLKAVFDTQDSIITSFDVNPRAPLIAVGLRNGEILIYDYLGYRKRTLRGHNAEVNVVAWDLGGRRLASCDSEGRLIIWTSTRKIQCDIYSYGDTIVKLKWSRRGKYLLGCTKRGIINIWNPKTGRTLYRFDLNADIYSVDWAPHTEQIVFSDSNCEVGILDLRHVSKYILGRHICVIPYVFWTDNNRIISVSWDGVVRIWDPNCRKPLYEMLIDHGPIVGASMSRSGRYLALAQLSSNVILVDFRNRRASLIFRFEGDIICNVGWSPRSEKLLVLSHYGKLGILNIAENRVENIFTTCISPITSLDLALGAGCIILGYADGRVALYDLSAGSLIREEKIFENSVSSISFNRHKSIFAVSSGLDKICLVDLALRVLYSKTLPVVGINVVRFCPTGRQILIGTSQGDVIILDGSNLSIISRASSLRGSILDASWNKDGSRFVITTRSGYLEIWDANSGKPRKTYDIRKCRISCVDWNKKINFIALGTLDGRVYVWDIDRASIYAHFDSHSYCVTDIAWSPDGAKLASCGSDGKVIVYNLIKKTYRTKILGQPVCSLSWIEGERRLLCGCKNGDVVVVDV